jgi:ribonuclease P protein component
MSESLRPHERIRKKSDFVSIYKKGNRFRGKYFNLVYLSNALDHSRMAAVASKKVGNAVKRNKAKRWMRVLYRRKKELLNDTQDLVMIAKAEILEATWPTLEEEYLKAIRFINKRSQST